MCGWRKEGRGSGAEGGTKLSILNKKMSVCVKPRK